MEIIFTEQAYTNSPHLFIETVWPRYTVLIVKLVTHTPFYLINQSTHLPHSHIYIFTEDSMPFDQWEGRICLIYILCKCAPHCPTQIPPKSYLLCYLHVTYFLVIDLWRTNNKWRKLKPYCVFDTLLADSAAHRYQWPLPHYLINYHWLF